jgi:hypothetical protein
VGVFIAALTCLVASWTPVEAAFVPAPVLVEPADEGEPFEAPAELELELLLEPHPARATAARISETASVAAHPPVRPVIVSIGMRVPS